MAFWRSTGGQYVSSLAFLHPLLVSTTVSSLFPFRSIQFRAAETAPLSPTPTRWLRSLRTRRVQGGHWPARARAQAHVPKLSDAVAAVRPTAV